MAQRAAYSPNWGSIGGIFLVHNRKKVPAVCGEFKPRFTKKGFCIIILLLLLIILHIRGKGLEGYKICKVNTARVIK